MVKGGHLPMNVHSLENCKFQSGIKSYADLLIKFSPGIKS